MESHQQQEDLVRERFTRTAQVFGDDALVSRVAEAEQLACIVRAKDSDRAVDLACCPGTLALGFAQHVRWICGLDLTSAILERARRSAADQGLANLDFAVGDAQSLPFADGSLDIAVTSDSLHHLPDAARTIGEMARGVKRGGRVGILDIFLPFDHWMPVARWKPGDRAYIEARRLMEASMADDAAWFHPRFEPAEDGSGTRELIFTNTTLFIAGEKI